MMKSMREAFQFHYGSVKSKLSTGGAKTFEHFNSTMVRLKDGYESILFKTVKDFNSTMVRLKARGFFL